MPFVPFRERFRELAERETRSITLLEGSPHGLPAGDYGFIELFCDEVGCDCRRVLFSVISTTSRNDEAVINFGWESREFYAKWMKRPDAASVTALKGPALQFGCSQGEHAQGILELAKQVLFTDRAFIDRVQRHYAMFRETVARTARHERSSPKIGRNDPCPCGSGRKHKKCCG